MISNKRPVLPQASALFLISAAVYLNTLSNGFVFDDNLQVLQNPWIRDLANIPAVFKGNVWAFRGSISNYYRPVMHIIYMLGYQLSGFAPWGFHLMNIVLNTAVCLLVFMVARRLFKDCGLVNGASYLPLIAALIFAVHPVHTEAVAWVAGAPDLSYAFFYLLSFYYYMLSRSGGASSGRAVLISVAAFFVAMLCKEPAATLPAVLFGYDYAVKKSRDGWAEYLKRYSPYAAAIAVYITIRVMALGGFSPNPPSWQLSPLQVAVNIPPLFSQYLEKLLLPIGLNVSHTFRPIESLSAPPALLGAAVAAAFLAALIVSLRKRSVFAMGLLLIAAPLIPSLYFPAISSRNVFGERYLYLPVLGFALLLCLLYGRVRERMPATGKPLAVFLFALIAAYSAGTVARNAVWADDITLWSDSVQKAPDNSFAHDSLGTAYYKKDLVDRAIAEFTAAVRIDNENLIAHIDLAGAYLKKGMLDEALGECDYVLTGGCGTGGTSGGAAGRAPGYPRASRLKSACLGNAHEIARTFGYLGAIYATKGQLDEAEDALKQAISLDPRLAVAHDDMGKLHARKGRLNEAMAELGLAIKLDPMRAETYNDLGVIYVSSGRSEDALRQFNAALKADPRYVQARINLGIVYARTGRMDLAVEQLEAALKLDPGNAALRGNLLQARDALKP